MTLTTVENDHGIDETSARGGGLWRREATVGAEAKHAVAKRLSCQAADAGASPVLVMWGRGDYVASRGDHLLIRDIVNEHQPGRATLVELDADHWFSRSTTFEESYSRLRSGGPIDFSQEVFDTMGRWLQAHGGPVR